MQKCTLECVQVLNAATANKQSQKQRHITQSGRERDETRWGKRLLNDAGYICAGFASLRNLHRNDFGRKCVRCYVICSRVECARAN